VNDYDLFTEAGSPTVAVEIILTINIGVTVGASTTSNYAIYCSTALPSGSTLKIINKGTIYGAGGAGSETSASNGTYNNGGNGGPALSLGCTTTILNATGKIFGGGGGGSSSDWVSGVNAVIYGGGGGAGSTPGAAGWVLFQGDYFNALPGTAAAGGRGVFQGIYPGSGLFTPTSGGGLGSPGLIYSSATHQRGLPGDAGRAVDRNGYTLTFASGETAAQVKGAYA